MQETSYSVGDLGSSPGLGRSPGEGIGKPLHTGVEIPWTEEPGGLQSMGVARIGHDLATKHHYLMVLKADEWNSLAPIMDPDDRNVSLSVMESCLMPMYQGFEEYVWFGGIPHGPVVRTLSFHCWGSGFNPGSGNWDHIRAMQCSQKKKKKRICTISTSTSTSILISLKSRQLYKKSHLWLWSIGSKLSQYVELVGVFAEFLNGILKSCKIKFTKNL